MTFMDRALDLITAIATSVKEVADSYAQLPTIIEQEHAAILSGNLDQVELVAASKLTNATKIERGVGHLRNVCKTFQELAAEFIPTKLEFSDLSANFTLIQTLAEVWKEAGHDTVALEQRYQELVAAFDAFLQIKTEISTQLEVNRLVLSRLLANRQENYRFWQEVTADTMAAYNKGGKQKAARSSSTLKIKA